MKVAKYYNNKDVRIEELPVPETQAGEVLVKAHACGICGSDVLEWYRAKKAPCVLGHEMTGEIAEVGSGVEKYNKGDRVFISHHVPCLDCNYCKTGHETDCELLHNTNLDPGGFSEYIRVPKINVEKQGVFILPEEISYEEGTFIEPLGCVVRGQRIADIGKDQTVLVLGSGIAGILHIQLAKAKGAKRIIATDISEYRLNAAKKFGADFAVNAKENVPEKVKELNENRLADRVIVCTGAVPAIEQALKSVDRGGTILFFAPAEPGIKVEIDFNELWGKGVTLTNSYAAAPGDIEETIELLKAKKINVNDMITHKFPLAEIQKGFDLVASAGESLKVIIELQK